MQHSPSSDPASRLLLALRWVAAGLIVDGLRRLIAGPGSGRASGLLGAAEAVVGVATLDRSPIDPAALYRLVAPVYDALSPIWRDWLYREPMRAFDKAVATALPPGGAVLDLGCGTGAILERLLTLDGGPPTYVGVDRSPAMLARAAAKFGGLAGVRFEQLDLRSDPLPSGPFDLVVSAWALEHLSDPTAAVRAAMARVRPGGHAVLFFEINGGGMRAWLLRRIWRFFGAPLVARQAANSWPGLVSLRRFGGAGPSVALAVLSADESR